MDNSGGRSSLPPIGVNARCTGRAERVPLKLNVLGSLTLDFRGGLDLGTRAGRSDGLVLEVRGFRMEADTSPATPGTGMLVTLSEAHAPLTALSVLRPLPEGGAEMLIHLALTLHVREKPHGDIVLELFMDPARHATLRARGATAFPPVDQHCTLQEPVLLYPRSRSADDRIDTTAPAGELPAFGLTLNPRA
ncbi:hypothetical protein [Streptomyces sp. CC219B]|uniref:hypothetical protein n=1 Tax=Streptomyces sp. CC219B TaxID=3044574 RepID=UPI0024A8EE72|nr:hypothetical protein [Streptomyces sp. CC219B]